MDQTIGLGMGRDLFYLNDEPESRMELRGICAATASKIEAIAKANNIPFWTTHHQELIQMRLKLPAWLKNEI